MIPADSVTAWAVDHPWPTRVQIEQVLLLSRAICEIAADPYLGAELVFRGGTALHKLHLPRPYRYSEDLDYVRSTASGIAELARALTQLICSGVLSSGRVSRRRGATPAAARASSLRLVVSVSLATRGQTDMRGLVTAGRAVRQERAACLGSSVALAEGRAAHS